MKQETFDVSANDIKELNRGHNFNAGLVFLLGVVNQLNQEIEKLKEELMYHRSIHE